MCSLAIERGVLLPFQVRRKVLNWSGQWCHYQRVDSQTRLLINVMQL